MVVLRNFFTALLAFAICSLASAQNCQPNERLFDHELLASEPLCIPKNPQRILALDMASLEMALIAGKEVVGSSNWVLGEMPVLQPQTKEALKNTRDVGYPADLEASLALKPDIILASGETSVGSSINAAQASRIAPVVLADPIIYDDWQKGMAFWAAVLNQQDRYNAMLANYQARIGELRGALSQQQESISISVVPLASGAAYMWMPDTAPGSILQDVGLSRPAPQSLLGKDALKAYGSKQYIQVSEERYDLLDADHIFYFTYAASDPETVQEEAGHIQTLEKDAIWNALSAVSEGHAYLVGGHWWRCHTYTTANLVLDDLFVHLTGKAATTKVLEVF